jgi:hypothetical protein
MTHEELLHLSFSESMERSFPLGRDSGLTKGLEDRRFIGIQDLSGINAELDFTARSDQVIQILLTFQSSLLFIFGLELDDKVKKVDQLE